MRLACALLTCSIASAQFIGPTRSRYPVLEVSTFAGVNAGAKIAACITALPSSGGVCDARAFTGNQGITTDPFAGAVASGKGVVLLLGSASYYTDVPIVIPPNSAIVGTGREPTGSRILATPIFPVNQAVVELGPSPGPNFGVRVESLSINCSSRPGSIGVRVRYANALSWARHLGIYSCADTGLKVENSALHAGPHEDLEIYPGSVAVAATTCIDANVAQSFRGLSNVLCNAAGYTVKPNYGIRLRGGGGGNVYNVTIIDVGTGILLESPSTVRGVVGSVSVSTIVAIASGTREVVIENIQRNSSTYTLSDANTSTLLTDDFLAFYTLGGSGVRLSSSPAIAAALGSDFGIGGRLTVGSTPFENLGSSYPNGTVVYCTNCSQTTPCTGGGSGAFAERTAGAWACASGVGGSLDPLPNVEATFTAQTSVTVTHNRNTKAVLVACRDASDNYFQSAWQATSVNAVTVTFGVSRTGTCTVNTGAGGGAAGGLQDPGVNGILIRTGVNATAARSVVGGNGVCITNGDGTIANPTISVCTATVGTYLTATAALTFGAIANNTCSRQTFALTNAIAGQAVSPIIPAALPNGWAVSVWPTATDTITVQACNHTGSTVGLSSMTYGAWIHKTF